MDSSSAAWDSRVATRSWDAASWVSSWLIWLAWGEMSKNQSNRIARARASRPSSVLRPQATSGDSFSPPNISFFFSSTSSSDMAPPRKNPRPLYIKEVHPFFGCRWMPRPSGAGFQHHHYCFFHFYSWFLESQLLFAGHAVRNIKKE